MLMKEGSRVEGKRHMSKPALEIIGNWLKLEACNLIDLPALGHVASSSGAGQQAFSYLQMSFEKEESPMGWN